MDEYEDCNNIFERLSNSSLSSGASETADCVAKTTTINSNFPGVMKKLILNHKIQIVSKVTVPSSCNNDASKAFTHAPINHLNGVVTPNINQSSVALQNGGSPEETRHNKEVDNPECVNTMMETEQPALTEVELNSGHINQMDLGNENLNFEENRNIFEALINIVHGDNTNEMNCTSYAENICNDHQSEIKHEHNKNIEENIIQEIEQRNTPEITVVSQASDADHIRKFEDQLPSKIQDNLSENNEIQNNIHNGTLLKNLITPEISNLSSETLYDGQIPSPPLQLLESTSIEHSEILSIPPAPAPLAHVTNENEILPSQCNFEKDAVTSFHEQSIESENSNDSNLANLRRSNRIKLKVERSDSNTKSNEDNEADLENDEPVCIVSRNPTDRLFSIDPNSKGFPDFKQIYENIWYSTKKKSKSRKHTRNMVCECVTSREDRRSGIAACGESCLNRLLMIECGSRCPCGDYCTNKSFQRLLYAQVEVFKTEFKGWGLRALREIDPGDLIMEYCGEIIDPKEFARRSAKYSIDKQQHFYFMALSQDEIIDATKKGNVSRFINHSCDPNAETQKWTVNGRLRIGFFALKPITVGTEITFDYQFERYGKVAQKCYCGSEKCRGYLGGAPDKDETSPLKQTKAETFDDNAIAWEISHIRDGLSSADDALSLCRLMVRCDTLREREMSLEVLQNTKMQTYLKSFMQYHGLSLIWSWMVDLPETDSNRRKFNIICTLEKLPIATKNALDDSNILPVVKRWMEECVSAVANASNETTEDDNPVVNVEELPDDSLELAKDMLSRMERLVEEWKDLREVYRIPKRQLQKTHSAASSPSRDSRHDSSPTATSRRKRRSDDRNNRHSHHHRRRSPRSSSHSRRRRSSPRKRRYSNSCESSPSHSAADDWSMERSKEEHRKQFEREMKLKEQIPTITDRRPYVENNIQQSLMQMADPSIYNSNLIQMTPMMPQQQQMTTLQQTQLTMQQQQLATVQQQQLISLQQQQLVAQQQMGMMPQYLTYVQPTPAYNPTLISAAVPNPVLQNAQQPLANDQGGVTILGSQGNQAIVLLSAEQLQQLTQTGSLQPPQPATTPAQPATTSTNQSKPAEPTPVKQDDDKLPANWKTAKDAEGKTYYYHAITRQTQWDRPTSSGNPIDAGGSNESEEMEISTPTHDERQSKLKVELTGEAKKVAEREKHGKDMFRLHLSKFVVKCLGHYRKSTCKKGRVTSSEDFKHIARKLTHNLMEKEMKSVKNFEDLEFNANVKHKTKEYIHKYMAKVGPVYRIRDDHN